MATPLVATKLFRPRRRPGALARSPLLARLDEGIDARLTLITAPAGFGKTSLLAEWMARRSHTTAWLSLDSEHRDPRMALAYLIASIQPIAEGFCEGLAAALAAPGPVSMRDALVTFINELVAVPERLVIILDDYHLADTDAFAQALQFLLANLPSTVSMVVSTRARPQLPLERLRARGLLVEIRTHDLRFTDTEARAFLRNVMGLDLSADDAATLNEWTEGWPAGMQLAGLAMRRRDGPLDIVGSHSESRQLVVDYLVHEVVDQLPSEVRAFLERTSILERMSGPLCDALLMAPPGTGQARLEALEQDNVFIVPLDDERRWYRYHHLFGSLLRRRLETHREGRDEPNSLLVRELHARASTWFERHGFAIEAFRHAAASDDVERASDLMGRGTPLPLRGAAAPVFDWLHSLPEHVRAERPMLGVWLAYASALLGNTDDVERTLAAAERNLFTAPGTSAPADALGLLATVRMMLAIAKGDTTEVATHARQALEHLPSRDAGSGRDAARWALGFAKQRSGEREAALREFDAILADSDDDSLVFRVAACTGRGQIQEDRGALEAAVLSFERAVDLAGAPPLPYACEAQLGLARVHYDWNDLDRAQALAEDALRSGSQLPSVETPAAAHLLLARIALARSRAAEAAKHVHQAQRIAAERQAGHLEPILVACRVRLATFLDDRTELARLLAGPMTGLAAARAHLASGQTAEALARLGRHTEEHPRQHSYRETLEVLVLRALAHAAMGDDEQAIDTLHEAMARAEIAGFVRVFVDEGVAIQPLVAGMRRGVAIRPTVLEALDEDRRRAGSTAADRRSHDEAFESLSDSELEVLRLIAEGHSNKEIARRLYRAVSTIKGHNRSLFAKLHVRNRTEAVARARRLELL